MEINEEEIKEIKEKKEKRTTLERSLESLARIVEFGFTCSAVFMVNNNLYVTTNDSVFSKNAAKREDVALISKFINHLMKTKKTPLKNLLQNNNNNNNNNNENNSKEIGFKKEAIELLLKSYKKKKSAAVKSGVITVEATIEDKEVEKVIDKLLEDDQYWDFKDEYFLKFESVFSLASKSKDKRKVARKKHNRITILRQLCTDLWRDIHDYRNVCESFNKGDLNSIQGSYILLVEDEGVHAEMRSISYLLRLDDLFLIAEDSQDKEKNKLKMKKNIYIGISKLCCKDCHETITKLNKRFVSSNFSIKVGGTHELVVAKWKCPKFFELVGTTELNDHMKMINEEDIPQIYDCINGKWIIKHVDFKSEFIQLLLSETTEDDVKQDEDDDDYKNSNEDDESSGNTKKNEKSVIILKNKKRNMIRQSTSESNSLDEKDDFSKPQMIKLPEEKIEIAPDTFGNNLKRENKSTKQNPVIKKSK